MGGPEPAQPFSGRQGLNLHDVQHLGLGVDIPNHRNVFALVLPRTAGGVERIERAIGLTQRESRCPALPCTFM